MNVGIEDSPMKASRTGMSGFGLFAADEELLDCFVFAEARSRCSNPAIIVSFVYPRSSSVSPSSMVPPSLISFFAVLGVFDHRRFLINRRPSCKWIPMPAFTMQCHRP